MAHRDDPALAGPLAELASKIAGKVGRGVLGQRDLDPSGLEADDANEMLEGMLQLELAPGDGEGYHVLEPLDLLRRLGARPLARPGHGSRLPPARRRRRQDGRGHCPSRPVAATGLPGRRRHHRERPHRLVGRRQVGGVRDADEHHVGGGERAWRGARLLDALQQHLPGAGERPQRQFRSEFAAARPLLLGERVVLRGAGRELQARDEMGEGGQVLEHDGGIGADLIEALQPRQGVRDVAAHDVAEEVDDQRPVGEAEHGAHLARLEPARGVSNRLVEEGERVARRALGGARDHAERRLVDLDRFLRGDALHQPDQASGLDPAEVEALAAGEHGDRHLAHLGGGEDEADVLRRLLERLQKAVEGGLRQHVDFVDDVDLVAGDRRPVARRLDDLADVVDAGVRGGVHLDHVDMAAFHDGGAVLAELLHVDRRPVDLAGERVVERAGKDAGGRRLADAADAGEHIGLRDASGAERIGQGADHRLLADQLGEAPRPVFPGKDPVRPAALVIGGIQEKRPWR